MSDQTTLQRKIQELTALYEISRELAVSLDLKSACQKVMEVLANTLGMTRGTLTLLDIRTGEQAIEVAHGISKEAIARGRYRIGEGITGKVLQTGEPMVIPNVGTRDKGQGTKMTKEKFGTSSLVPSTLYSVPVKAKGEILGVLSVERPLANERVVVEEDVRILTVVASLIGQAVKINQMFTESKRNLIETNLALRQELKSRYKLEHIIGTSKRMQEVFAAVEQVSLSKVTILLRGESGTGKELIAHAIHYHSPRAEQPFIKLSCAALPETLLESELFGHERGAFTGAIRAKPGRFELADGGTLFLDEIGDIPVSIQVKLLRVLQEKRFERVGGTKTISVDVRIITATNRDLEAAMHIGQFREDLYYRLNVVPLFIPPLRERKEDIPALLVHFLARFNAEYGKEVQISPEGLQELEQYHWPGNVRELENCIERMVVQARADIIQPGDLPVQIRIPYSPQKVGTQFIAPESGSLSKTIEEIEKEEITAALVKCGGVQARAARLLGISPRQLGYKLKKYHISIPSP